MWTCDLSQSNKIITQMDFHFLDNASVIQMNRTCVFENVWNLYLILWEMK